MKRIVIVGLGLAALIGCGGEADPPPTVYFSPIHVRDGQFVDGSQRLVLLHGINARIDGLFDVTFDDGRIPVEEVPPLTAADCLRMKQLGFDHIRVPINWSGVEPQRDQLDEAYLARVDAVIACAEAVDLFVIIDLHQDAYSKEIGEDGAPLWAIVPPPEMLLQGPLTDLGDRRTSGQVTSAFDSFFAADDAHQLQAEFIAMLEHLGRRWADTRTVIGFEIFNEPTVGFALVDAFNIKAAAALRAAAPQKLVFFEPSAIRNFIDGVPQASDPFPTTGAVYAPHIYTFVFHQDQTPLQNLQPADLEPSVMAARAEADAWATPLWVGEYGVGPATTNADLWMGVENELFDRYLVSRAFWLWKEQSQGSWGLHDFDAASGTWTERPQVVGWLSRIHAQRIAGDLISNRWDRLTGALEVTVEPGTVGEEPTVIYVPYAPGEFFATCDGNTVIGRGNDYGQYQYYCGGVLRVSPR